MRATGSGPDARRIRLSREQEHIRGGFGIVIDLEKFFDRVNHDILMGLVAKRVADPRVLRTCAFRAVDHARHARRRGGGHATAAPSVSGSRDQAVT